MFLHSFVYFSCFIVLVRTSGKMYNSSGESQKICAIISSNIFFYPFTCFLSLWDSVIYMCNYTCRYCSTQVSQPQSIFISRFFISVLQVWSFSLIYFTKLFFSSFSVIAFLYSLILQAYFTLLSSSYNSCFKNVCLLISPSNSPYSLYWLHFLFIVEYMFCS